jgi:hypothetical protein
VNIKVKIGREEHDQEGNFMTFVDFVTDEVDLVVNPHFQPTSYDSTITRQALQRCGVEGPWRMFDGDVFGNGVQYVTVAFGNPEDVVKVRLLMQETTTIYQYTKEDLQTC